MFKKTALSLLISFTFLHNTVAQSKLAHEIGIISGPVSFKSDYGQRNNYTTNVGNTGFGIGLVHFLNFSYNAKHETYFNEHFKVRSEISYSHTNLHHFGETVNGNPNKIGVIQLKAMSGSTSLANIGTQLEYSPFMKIHDFENTIGAFSPYISAGIQVSYYNAKASSKLGPLGNPATTFYKYLTPSDGHAHGFSNQSGTVLSFTTGIGVHYKLAPLHDLLFEARFQYYNSDWVDGLNPNKEIYKENKSNDAQVWFTFGYAYYLDF
ncbi:outer membrane beta-barrel protein [Flavobacterium sp. LS1R49]|uniref:Outer membrane beta-barrel protein n=1 Tax=Flavobacterium shii TaxID=2987687 RepID=A0A9X2ZAW3_9FLAO|nr:outer membrane beta-barrel protein [Flavobacterium shii]MCV9927781.1 outer membrane beta-barrel protein [Flavobacterium shii]